MSSVSYSTFLNYFDSVFEMCLLCMLSPMLCLRLISLSVHQLEHRQPSYHQQPHIYSYILGHQGNFNKYPTGYIDMLGQPYDYGSIMHYSAYAFAIDRTKMTIEPKQSGVTIGQRHGLSATDIKEIQILYGCIARDGSGSTVTGFVTAPPTTTPKPPAGCKSDNSNLLSVNSTVG